MEANVRLYALNYDEAKTYLWATVFVACNLVLPQLFHLIPQGGIIFSPLSLVILAGAYKFGWKTGLLAALASPLVNHLITGMPAWEVMPVMTMKLAVLALVAGLAAQRFKTVSLPLVPILQYRQHPPQRVLKQLYPNLHRTSHVRGNVM